MILLALLAAAGAPPSDDGKARFDACVARSDTDASGAVTDGKAWAGSGGGVPAGQCLGIAQSAAGDWPGAADTFAATADIAERTDDPRAANLWVSAGNAALAGGRAAQARTLLDRGLALPLLEGQMRGEALLDRARAGVALDDLPGARADMDAALAAVPADPMAWLLSATLARRAGDGVRAATDIREAASRAPNDPSILLEQGRIAAAAGDVPAARTLWARVRTLAPGSDAAQGATAALDGTGGIPPTPPTVIGR